jgi:tetratricopeptide (TPR) repeat protein
MAFFLGKMFLDRLRLSMIDGVRLTSRILFSLAAALFSGNAVLALDDFALAPVNELRYKKLIFNHKNSYTPDEVLFLCIIGEEFRENKHIAEAKVIFEKLRKSNCITPDVLCGSAFTYMDDLDDTADADKAEKFLKQAIALDKNCSKAYCRLAEIALLQDRLEESLTYVNQSLKCPVKYSSAYLLRARVLNMLKRYDQAYKAALDAEKYMGKFVSVYSTKAGILAQMGRYAEAAEAFRQSDRYHASDWARHQIINCLIKAGKPEEALKETARLLAIVPNDPDAFRLRSSIYKQLKNYHAALKDLDKVIAIEPSSIAYKERADLYARMGNMEKSKADLAAARKILE